MSGWLVVKHTYLYYFRLSFYIRNGERRNYVMTNIWIPYRLHSHLICFTDDALYKFTRRH